MPDATIRSHLRGRNFLALSVISIACISSTALSQTRATERASRSMEASGQMLLTHALSLYNRKNPDDLPEALDFFRRAASDFNEAQAYGKQAVALLGAGFVLRQLGQDHEALRHFQGALNLYRKIKHRPGEIDALLNCAAAHYGAKELDKSLDLFNEALALSQKEGERKSTAIALSALAQIYTDKKELQKAMDAYNQALPIFRVLGDHDSEARATHNIEVISEMLRESEKARN